MKSESFTYYHPIFVRYADLDPQGHVNNAVYLTYMESARLGYYQASGIWHPDFGSLTGMVVAKAEIEYLAPVFMSQTIRVGVRLETLGTTSLTFAFQIESVPDSKPLARGRSVMVAFDTEKGEKRPVPAEWREKLTRFEEMDK